MQVMRAHHTGSPSRSKSQSIATYALSRRISLQRQHPTSDDRFPDPCGSEVPQLLVRVDDRPGVPSTEHVDREVARDRRIDDVRVDGLLVARPVDVAAVELLASA